jgi:cellulose synthase/poly-beta-1,6-N-acetylglucosamine synthase-like glycosyltransferase
MMTRYLPAGSFSCQKGFPCSCPAISASSIVIPAYNESARIESALREVVSCIRERGWDAEVIVVNDGSTDSTARQVLDFARTAPEVRLIENPGNRGKGYSACAMGCCRREARL